MLSLQSAVTAVAKTEASAKKIRPFNMIFFFEIMGQDHIVHLFIGRACTPDEVKRYWDALKDMNPDAVDWQNCGSLLDADKDMSYFKTADGWPIVLHQHGWGVSTTSELLQCDVDQFRWFVVEQYLCSFSDRYSVLDDNGLDFRTWEAQDDRHRLLVVPDFN
jgi:hypothetical protein